MEYEVVRTDKFLESRIAFCNQCRWNAGDDSATCIDARRHVRETGHSVQIELVYKYEFVQKARGE